MLSFAAGSRRPCEWFLFVRVAFYILGAMQGISYCLPIAFPYIQAYSVPRSSPRITTIVYIIIDIIILTILVAIIIAQIIAGSAES